ncbi:MAG: hypothetical protein JRF33_03340 [Deltaproteobacteria bacterium]|nr:hypothetical protein [Deltaproteobacteria bacterium]
MTKNRFAWICFFILFAPTVWAGGVTPFGKEKPIKLADFRPHPHGMEWYGEQWSHGVWTDKGRHFVGVDFVISNVGFGDHKATFKAAYKHADGTQTKCKAEFDSDEWSWSKQGFSIQAGKNKISGDLKGLNIHAQCGAMTMDLRFENEVAPLRPGGGKLVYGQDGIYDMMFTSPRAKVSGSAKIGGKTIPIHGWGHADHSYTTMAPHKSVRRWFRFKHVTKDISILMAELQTPVQYAGGRHGWVMLLSSKGRHIATAKVRYGFDGFIKDEKSEEGYRIPRRVSIKASEGESKLEGQVLMTSLKSVKDPTASWGGLARTIARRVSKPRDYRMNCAYQLTFSSQGGSSKLQGEGDYQYFFINP